MDLTLRERARFVAVYCRVSTDGQAEQGNSLENQRAICERIARIRWPERVVQFYDDVMTGTSANRPGYQELMRDVRRGNVAVVLMTELSRIWRRTIDGLALLDQLEKAGTRLATVDGQLDTTSPFARAVVEMMLVLASTESRVLGERVRRGHQENLFNGRRGPGCRPYGWQVTEKGDLVADDDEQRVIDFVLQERADRRSLLEICKQLERLGKRGVTGKKFSPGGLQSMIKSATNRRAALISGRPGGIPK